MIGKVGFELEDPISQILYNLSDIVSPFLYKIKFTPNIITAFRFIILIIGLYIGIKNNNKKLIAITYIIFYFMDCLDGHYARKYNMVTSFGDYFDHGVDILSIIMLLLYLLKTIKNQYFLIIFFFLLFTSMMHIGCEELLLKMDGKNMIISESLTFLQKIVPVNQKEYLIDFMIKIRYLGTGTLVMFVVIYLLLS